jgi:hypothetical protein
MVWFPGGKQDIEDATPECTTMRALTETTRFKAEWVREVRPTVYGEKYRKKLAYGIVQLRLASDYGVKCLLYEPWTYAWTQL